MDEVTSTETLSQEVPNAECPFWQYVTKVEKPLGRNFISRSAKC